MKTFPVTALTFALLATGCFQADPAGTADEQGKPEIQDQDLLAGATSSTNWPQEDAGWHPVEIFGTTDSGLVFSFKRAPDSGGEAIPFPLGGKASIYRAGLIPIFDPVPARSLQMPVSDSFRISPEDFKSLFPNEMDTLSFSVELSGSDSTRAFIPGFVYSRIQKKFLRLPPIFGTTASVPLTDRHYKFAGIPDSLFRIALNDTAENARFYYYIPGSPYFWEHSLKGDSLYIGPIPNGQYPLRFVKVKTHAGSVSDFVVEVYPLSLVKETVNDSLHRTWTKDFYRVGSLLFLLSGKGILEPRDP